jgi:hypothetical protein
MALSTDSRGCLLDGDSGSVNCYTQFMVRLEVFIRIHGCPGTVTFKLEKNNNNEIFSTVVVIQLCLEKEKTGNYLDLIFTRLISIHRL